MDNEIALKEYGLNDKEIKVYMALLPLGNINLQEIAKRVDMPRTTIYNTLNYLSNKGLISILNDIFRLKQQTYYFGSYSLSKEMLKHQPEHFRTIRLDRKIPAKIVIDPYDEDTFHRKEYKKITEMRYLKSLKDFPCMVFIYGKRVAIIQ